MKSESRQSALVVPALIVAVCSISFAAIFFRKAHPTHPLVAAGIRLAVAGILLSPLTIRSAIKGKISKRLLTHAIGAGFAYGIHFGAWVTSLTLTTVAASVTLVTTTPLILAAAGTVIGRDRPNRQLWVCLGMAFIGLLFIGGKDLTLGVDVIGGDLLALLGALAMAGYLTIGRRLGNELDLWAFSGIATSVAAMFLLGAAWVLGIDLLPVSYEAFFYLVLAAILPQLVGHNLLTWVLRFTSPSVVGMAVVGEPVGSTLLAWLWLSETITTPIAIGCGITILSVAWAIRTADFHNEINRKRSSQTTPTPA